MFCFQGFLSSSLSLLWILSQVIFLFPLHLFGLSSFFFQLCSISLPFHFFLKVIMFEVAFSQASRKVEFFPWRRLKSFFLMVSVLLRLVQWFVQASYRVRLVLSFCLFVFPLIGKAEWGGNPVCWWRHLYFCFACCLDEASCTRCYWWLGEAGSCIQIVSVVWVLTIWCSIGLALW